MSSDFSRSSLGQGALVPGGGSQGGGIMEAERGNSESGYGNRTPRYTAQETEPRLPVTRNLFSWSWMICFVYFHRLNNWHPCKNSLHPLHCDHRGVDVWGLDLHSSLRWSTPLLPQNKWRENIKFREGSHKWACPHLEHCPSVDGV